MTKYRKQLKKVLNPNIKGENHRLLNAALGLCSESGEFAQGIRKCMYQDQNFDLQNQLQELGDIRFYLEVACIELNTSMKEIEELNMKKLQKRYPKGFK